MWYYRGYSIEDELQGPCRDNGYTKEDAITQARMAYILQKDQYNGLDEYPSMWQPPSEKLIHEPKLWRTKGRDKWVIMECI